VRARAAGRGAPVPRVHVRALIRWGGPWAASVVVGLLFGAVHAFGTPAILLLQLAMLGFLFCLVR